MNGSGSPITNALGFWMMIQLVSTLMLLLGGLYALFCLSRAASGLDRLASAVEDLVARGASPTGTFNPNSNPSGTMPVNVMPANSIPAPQPVETTSFVSASSAATPSNLAEMPFSTPPISAAVMPMSTGAAPVSYAPPSMNTPVTTSDAEKNDEYRR